MCQNPLPTYTEPSSRRLHREIIALAGRGLSAYQVAARLGCHADAVRKMLDIYGHPGELHTYPIEPIRCPACGRRVNRWPCVVCTIRENGGVSPGE